MSLTRCRRELAQNCLMLVTDLLEQHGDRFQIAGTSGRLGFRQTVGEKCRAYCAGARLERVRRGLDRFGISLLDRLLQSSEAPGTVLGERVEQRTDHVLDTGLGKVSAKALHVYARRSWDK
jgi:hypothetical protein